MRAAAELDRVGIARPLAVGVHAHADDAHLIAVFLAEQSERTLGDGLVGRHQVGLDGRVLEDHGVDQILHLADLGAGHRFLMREVEAEPPRLDQRALLRHMLSEHLAERLVQQMRRRMVRAGRRAAGVIHFETQLVAEAKRALRDHAIMEIEPMQLLLRVRDLKRRTLGAGQGAPVADLAAGLGIERRLVDDDDTALAFLQSIDAGAVLDQRDDPARRRLGLVAEELGRAELFLQFEPESFGRGLARSRPRLPRLGALLVHGGGETFRIDADPARLQRVLGQVVGKAISVVELERDLARQRGAARQPLGRIVEQAQAPFERLAEARLFELQSLLDQALPALELGVGAAHLFDQRRHQAIEQRLLGAENVRVAHGAAHDAAKHIAAALVGGQHAVGDQERRGAQMIGDDAMARRMHAGRGHAGQLDRGADQSADEIDGVIVVRALEHGGDTLDPHAGVDGRVRQLDALAASELLILHEHEIPDLDEAVAFGIGAAGRAARNAGPVVVENFRARSARSGIAHRPEIVAAGDADNLVVGEARDLAPERGRLVIVGEHGDEQPILGKRKVAGEKLPGEEDRALLEIIAEGEIAEHFEEGVMARGVADIVEVVVLAAGAHAFLRRGRPRRFRLLGPGEHVLERHHAGIGEHQRRVVARHERRRRHHQVIVVGEEVEKGGADVVGAARHGASMRGDGRAIPFRARARAARRA